VVLRPEAAVALEEIVAYLREEGIATFKLPALSGRTKCPTTGALAPPGIANCGTNCDNKEFAASAGVRYPLRIRLSRPLIGNSRR
jgi:hypothetical protein